jgi:hypothetical protein
MTKAKRIGGALVVILALAGVGCAGPGTSAESAPLQQDITTVDFSIDGRTDLFVDAVQSHRLLEADEVNGSPTAIPVEVQVAGDELIAWRLGSGRADLVAHWNIVGSDVSGSPLDTAVAIDNETHPGDPTTVVVPGASLGSLGRYGAQRGGSVGNFGTLHSIPTATGLHIDWSTPGGIPNATDVNTLGNIIHAHPGCA